MSEQLRVALELGPKGKRIVAVAEQWPGLERGAKTRDQAIQRLRDYLPRYAPVAAIAGMGEPFGAQSEISVVEDYPGVGSTDFWGISFAFSAFDRQPISNEELERELALMQAAWTFFDQVRERVSAELRRGPRGGGRMRDEIARHVLVSEMQFTKMVGIQEADRALLTGEGLRAHRSEYLEAIRRYYAEGKPAGKVAKWPLRYLIRHTAFHTLDHAWEMEDKDLTVQPESR